MSPWGINDRDTPLRRDYNELTVIVQSVMTPLLTPLTAEMQALKSEVHGLSIDRVTRSDLDKLRNEIRTEFNSFVPRDSYEPRHAALVERNTQLENELRELRKEHETDIQRIHERLESGKQQIADQIKEAGKAQLDDKDRNWIRGSQILSGICIVLTILSLIMQHVRFN